MAAVTPTAIRDFSRLYSGHNLAPQQQMALRVMAKVIIDTGDPDVVDDTTGATAVAAFKAIIQEAASATGGFPDDQLVAAELGSLIDSAGQTQWPVTLTTALKLAAYLTALPPDQLERVDRYLNIKLQY